MQVLKQRFQFLYGNTKDHFIDAHYRIMGLEHWLLHQLKAKGYERIVYYSFQNKLHFWDKHSSDLTRQPSNTPIPVKSSQANPVKPATGLQSGPLGSLNLRKKTAATNPQPPAGDVADAAPTLPIQYGTMSDVDAFRALDRLMKDDQCKTAVIFCDGDDLLSHIDSDAVRTLNSMLPLWSSSKLSITNHNLAIVIFGENLPNFEQTNLAPNAWLGLLYNPQAKALTDYCFHVSFAQADEVKRYLHYRRLTKKSAMTAQAIVEKCDFYSRQLIDKEGKVRRLTTLDNLADVEWRNPWQKLEAMPELNSRVGDKITHLVNTAKHASVKYGEEKTGEEKLSPDILRLTRQTIRVGNPVNLHIAISSNPGIGKTTLARLLAEIFQQEGILKTGHCVEVTAGDLIEEHVGGSAKRTREKIEQAQGGVLFIDEAYAISNNQFGQEVVDELVRAMTAFEGQFSVIIAGYPGEISRFVESNPGLKGRFPELNRWLLEDYSVDELLSILGKELSKHKVVISPAMQQRIKPVIKAWKEKDGAFFGNARNVIKLVESIAPNFRGSTELKAEHFAQYRFWSIMLGHTQLPNDFEQFLKDKNIELHNSNLRTLLEKLYHGFAHNLQHRADVFNMSPGHYIFEGSSGSGKTTSVDALTKFLYELGLIDKPGKVDLKAGELLLDPVKQKNIFNGNDGALVFIDEVHQLLESDAGRQFLKSLVPELSKRKERNAVVFAGYKGLSSKLGLHDPGYPGRIGNNIINFTIKPGELKNTFYKQLGMSSSDELEGHLKPLMRYLSENPPAGFGGHREMETIAEGVASIRALKARMNNMNHDIDITDIEEYIKHNYPGFVLADWQSTETLTLEHVMKDLDGLIGLTSVKDQIHTIFNQIKYHQKMGNSVNIILGHYRFEGPPGTGKTTVATMMGRIFQTMGVLQKGHVVEAPRDALIGRYQGHTAQQVKAKLDEAMDGILFIDEAYQLVSNEHDSYGLEAINTLVTYLDQPEIRRRVCVIFAGYEADIQKLLSFNAGLESRTSPIRFDNYSDEELVTIALKDIAKRGYHLTDGMDQLIQARLAHLKFSKRSFANAREARILVDGLVANLVNRVVQLDTMDQTVLTTIIADDMPS